MVQSINLFGEGYQHRANLPFPSYLNFFVLILFNCRPRPLRWNPARIAALISECCVRPKIFGRGKTCETAARRRTARNATRDISSCGLNTNEAPTSRLLERARACLRARDCSICALCLAPVPVLQRTHPLCCSAGPLDTRSYISCRSRSNPRSFFELKSCHVSRAHSRLRSHAGAFCHFTTFAGETAPENDPASPLLLYF